MRIYGEDIKKERIVSKILRTKTNKYDTPISVIQSTKDLSMLSALEMTGLFKAQK